MAAKVHAAPVNFHVLAISGRARGDRWHARLQHVCTAVNEQPAAVKSDRMPWQGHRTPQEAQLPNGSVRTRSLTKASGSTLPLTLPYSSCRAWSSLNVIGLPVATLIALPLAMAASQMRVSSSDQFDSAIVPQRTPVVYNTASLQRRLQSMRTGRQARRRPTAAGEGRRDGCKRPIGGDPRRAALGSARDLFRPHRPATPPPPLGRGGLGACGPGAAAGGLLLRHALRCPHVRRGARRSYRPSGSRRQGSNAGAPPLSAASGPPQGIFWQERLVPRAYISWRTHHVQQSQEQMASPLLAGRPYEEPRAAGSAGRRRIYRHEGLRPPHRDLRCARPCIVAGSGRLARGGMRRNLGVPRRQRAASAREPS